MPTTTDPASTFGEEDDVGVSFPELPDPDLQLEPGTADPDPDISETDTPHSDTDDVLLEPEVVVIQLTEPGRASSGATVLRNNGTDAVRITDIRIEQSSPDIRFSTSFATEMAVAYAWRQSETGQGWSSHPSFELRSNDSITVDIAFTPSTSAPPCDTELPSCGRLSVYLDEDALATAEIRFE